ncbi:MAG: MSMEG_4193 family putative phosphomutase [Actinomycetales bacterium]|nr:MSMEG_4193 family putative phosphomutase [Actinomycetales bacterium]
MPIVLLVRHGETPANKSGVLAGRTPGVGLTPRGREQAEQAGQRLAGLPLTHVAMSPLERTRETARLLRAAAGSAAPLRAETGLIECDYGSWTGKKLRVLARAPLWSQVQHRPSAVTFPEGESMRSMSQRAIAAIERGHQRATAAGGESAVWAAVTHGDVIKAIVADALGLHLDSFQRIHADPGSITIIARGPNGSYLVASNTRAGDLAHLARVAGERTTGQVGGGRG